MNLTSMLAALRIELQDAGAVWSNDELTRAVQKSVSLMSRLIPKRAIVETIIGGAVTSEVLTILSSTGTLAYKPIKPGSLVITGKTEGTHYRVNYLTGVITEIGSLLPDSDYTASYERDERIFNFRSVLPDFIKIERVEYPAGNDPPTNPPFDLIGDYILMRGQKIALTEKDHLRLIYLCAWTPPTGGEGAANGDYPLHLDNAIIIGSVGQALIFRAEKYVQSAVATLSTLTAPADYSYTEPASPTLPAAPTPPAAPSITFTDVNYALDLISVTVEATESGALKTAKDRLTTGAALINASTRGEQVGKTYGDYAMTDVQIGSGYATLAQMYMRELETTLALYANKVTSYGSEVNSYANNISGLVSKFRGDIDAEVVAVNNFSAKVQKYAAQINEQAMKASNFLEIAGRYLASGQAKINEMFIMLGVKTEFFNQKAMSEQRD